MTPTRKTCRPPSAATQRFTLKLAQTLFRWAVRRGYVRESPFEGVLPGGRLSRGKKQLRFDEAERFIRAAFRMFDKKGGTMVLPTETELSSLPLRVV